MEKLRTSERAVMDSMAPSSSCGSSPLGSANVSPPPPLGADAWDAPDSAERRSFTSFMAMANPIP